MESPAREKKSVDEVRSTDRSSIPIVEGVSESPVLSVVNHEVIVWARAFEGCSQVPEDESGHPYGLRGLLEKLVVDEDWFDLDVEEFPYALNKVKMTTHHVAS